MTGASEDYDVLDTARCPLHPLTRLVDEGTAGDGHDARWVCPEPGCSYVRLS